MRIAQEREEAALRALEAPPQPSNKKEETRAERFHRRQAMKAGERPRCGPPRRTAARPDGRDARRPAPAQTIPWRTLAIKTSYTMGPRFRHSA